MSDKPKDGSRLNDDDEEGDGDGDGDDDDDDDYRAPRNSLKRAEQRSPKSNETTILEKSLSSSLSLRVCVCVCLAHCICVPKHIGR